MGLPGEKHERRGRGKLAGPWGSMQLQGQHEGTATKGPQGSGHHLTLTLNHPRQTNHRRVSFLVEHLATFKAAQQHTIKDVEAEGKVFKPDSLPAEARSVPQPEDLGW